MIATGSSTRRLLLLGFALASCAQGQSCSCLGTLDPLPTPLPASAESQNGATLYLSTAGFDFLAQSFPTLISTFLPSGLAFSVPETPIQVGCVGTFCLVNENVCDPSACPYADTQLCASGCPLEATISGAQVAGQAPDELDVTLLITVDASAWGLSSSGACVAGGTGSACSNEVWISGSPLGCTVDLSLDQQPIEVPLLFTFDPVSQALSIKPGTVQSTFSASDFNFDCGLAGEALGLFKGLIAQQISSQISTLVGSQLQSTLDAVECMTPGFYSAVGDGGAGGACPPGSFIGTDSAGTTVCERNDDGGCVAKPLGLLGVGDLSAALSAEGPPPALTALAVFPGEASDAGLPSVITGPDSGMTLPFIDGFAALAPSDCAAPLPPQTYDLPAQIDFPIEAARLGARSYMLGLGLSQPLLQRAADQAYAGGVFCLALTGFGGSPLTTNTLAALFPELSELFPDVPLTLAFHPQNPPIVTIGAGTVQNNQPQDPLINLVLPGVRIDALASLDGRQVRAFAFTSDLTLPLAIIAGTGGTSVQIVLGSASNFLGNIQGEASDLLNLPAATVTVQLQKFLPLALGLAGNSLGSLPAIALPSIEGFSPSITAIGGIVPSGTGEFLDVGVFLNLGQAASAATPPGFSARLVGSSFPSANDVGPGGTLSALPAEILALEGGTAALEASYRIDDGPPSAWLRGSPLVIADPLLLLVGPHHLSVRVRPQGDLGSGDLTTLQVVSAFAAAPTATTVASVLAGPPSEPSSAVAIDASRSSCATGLGLGAWGLLALSFAGFLRRRR